VNIEAFFLVDCNSVHEPIKKKIGSPCLITARNRRGVFAYFFSWKKKVGPVRGQGARKKFIL